MTLGKETLTLLMICRGANRAQPIVLIVHQWEMNRAVSPPLDLNGSIAKK